MNVSVRHQRNGFSLIEIAVVLLIISVLVTIVAVPLSTQLEQRRSDDTRKQIELAKEALIGFAMANGRLPCPASATSNGVSSFCTLGTGACVVTTTTTAAILTHGRCSDSNGLLPAVTLGFSPVDAQGYAIDGWQDGSTLHRIRYAVSKFEGPTGIFPVTSKDGVRTATMDIVGADPVSPAVHLYICGTGLTAASSATACSVGVTKLTDRAVAVIYSVGNNAATAFASLSFDEQNNQGNSADIVFTSGDPNATFDDIVSWISINTLFARMVQAGKLP